MITGAFFCRPDEFLCNNTLCKLHSWVCDGEDDCGDNSDEDVELCGKKANTDTACFTIILYKLLFDEGCLFEEVKYWPG